MSEKRNKNTWYVPVLYHYEKPTKLGIFQICMVFMTLFLFCGYRGISFMKKQADRFLFYFCFLFMFENVHERVLYLFLFHLLPSAPALSPKLWSLILNYYCHTHTLTRAHAESLCYVLLICICLGADQLKLKICLGRDLRGREKRRGGERGHSRCPGLLALESLHSLFCDVSWAPSRLWCRCVICTGLGTPWSRILCILTTCGSLW